VFVADAAEGTNADRDAKEFFEPCCQLTQIDLSRASFMQQQAPDPVAGLRHFGTNFVHICCDLLEKCGVIFKKRSRTQIPSLFL